MSVKYNDVHIPGSPFQFTVGPLRDGGSHRVHAGGPGLERGEQGQPCEFNVWTREAGAGSLAISVEGPSKAQIDFKDRKDGSCYVVYNVSEPGNSERHLHPTWVLFRSEWGHRRSYWGGGWNVMTGDSPCTVSKANPGFSSATDDIYGAKRSIHCGFFRRFLSWAIIRYCPSLQRVQVQNLGHFSHWFLETSEESQNLNSELQSDWPHQSWPLLQTNQLLCDTSWRRVSVYYLPQIMSVFRHCTTHQLYIQQDDIPRENDGQTSPLFLQICHGPCGFSLLNYIASLFSRWISCWCEVQR